MQGKRILLLPIILLSLACSLTSAPLTETPSVLEQPAEAVTQPPVQTEAATETPMPAPINVSDYAIFSINV